MPQRAIEPLCFVVLLAGCLVGGSNEPGRMLLALPELISLPLLCLALLGGPQDNPSHRNAFWIVATILVLPLLQLIPLPSQVWAALPGRAPVTEAYATAGIALPWLPLSLTPDATIRVWLGLLPPVALFLAVPLLPTESRRRLTHAAVLLGVLDVALGFFQLVGGADSPLRLYANASRTDAVGLFANRNHQATFLAVLILLAGALAVGRRRPLAERLWLAGAGIVMLLGIAASGSRAGLVLGLGAGLGAAWIVATSRAGGRLKVSRWTARVLVGLVLLAGLGALVLRPRANVLADDLRWQIARTTWKAIVSVFPAGAGFGSFERLYAHFERPDELIAPFVNNAHDDWLEMTLEGGLPALVLLLLGVGYLVRETFFRRIEDELPAFARAVLGATLAALWLCALHSTVDYPLRTMTVNIVVALACGLRVAARGDDAERDEARVSDRRASGRRIGSGGSRRRVASRLGLRSA